VSSARTDLCGGRSAMIVPTATIAQIAVFEFSVVWPIGKICWWPLSKSFVAF